MVPTTGGPATLLGYRPAAMLVDTLWPLIVSGALAGGVIAVGGYVVGLVLQVPLFVSEGDTVRVDTRTGEYQTRV
jgi:hypothetical protein